MQGKYSNKSALELRELFLNGNLDADSIELADFEKLFCYETELGISEKNADVLVFCTRDMKRYEQYAEDVQLPPIEELFREFDHRNQQSEPAPVKPGKGVPRRKAPRAALIHLRKPYIKCSKNTCGTTIFRPHWENGSTKFTVWFEDDVIKIWMWYCR